MKYYAGIDVGKDGGIAIVDESGAIIELYLTPKIGKGYNKKEMCDMLKTYQLSHIVLEDVTAMKGWGTVSIFDFGVGKGIWEGILSALELPHTLIRPTDWQKEVYTLNDIKSAGGKSSDSKHKSLMCANRLFPKETFKPTSRYTKPHDGLVDAALIAEYCRRKFR